MAAAAPLLRVAVRAAAAAAISSPATPTAGVQQLDDEEEEDSVDAVLNLVGAWLLAGKGCPPQARATALSALYALLTFELDDASRNANARRNQTGKKKERQRPPGSMFNGDGDGIDGVDDDGDGERQTRGERVRRKAAAWLRAHPTTVGAGVVSALRPTALAKLPEGGPLAAVDLAVKVGDNTAF